MIELQFGLTEPSNIAELFLFLVRDKGGWWITAQTIFTDGQYTMR